MPPLTSETLFTLTAILLFGIGAHGLMQARHALRRLLALNICISATFLLLVASGQHGHTDPVPHAMVLTGIVVALSTTAVAIGLIVRRHGHRRPRDQCRH